MSPQFSGLHLGTDDLADRLRNAHETFGRWRGSPDRILVWLFVAGLLHAVAILGITFVKPDIPERQASTLDVILVQSESRDAPEDSQLLAQANQDGGGESEEFERPSSPLPAPLTGPTAEVVSSPPEPTVRADPGPQTESPAPAVPAEARSILASDESASTDRVVRRPPKPRARPSHLRATAPRAAPITTPVSPKPKIDAVTLMTRSLAYASLSAEVDRRLQEYASKPRRKWITARTRESKYAAYMDAWRTKVERIGNLNYPDRARREKMAGSLLLDVAINEDGTVNEVALRRSSGHKVLDDAAIRIVKLAAPFAPLPAAIRRDTDILHIERTWRFLNSNRLSSR